jgi:hypothetical protein
VWVSPLFLIVHSLFAVSSAGFARRRERIDLVRKPLTRTADSLVHSFVLTLSTPPRVGFKTAIKSFCVSNLINGQIQYVGCGAGLLNYELKAQTTWASFDLLQRQMTLIASRPDLLNIVREEELEGFQEVFHTFIVPASRAEAIATLIDQHPKYVPTILMPTANDFQEILEPYLPLSIVGVVLEYFGPLPSHPTPLSEESETHSSRQGANFPRRPNDEVEESLTSLGEQVLRLHQGLEEVKEETRQGLEEVKEETRQGLERIEALLRNSFAASHLPTKL